MKVLSSIAISITLIGLTIQPNPVYSQQNASFRCENMFDQASGKKVPMTVAWVPERKTHVGVIGWKSTYFEVGGWTSEKRCQEVSKKFQDFQNRGTINYLMTGKNNGYPIICAVAEARDECNSQSQLFTIKLGSNPELVLRKLIASLEASGQEQEKPIWQSSKDKLYLNLNNYLQQARSITISP
ncbi:MAG: COP23 domain-containing protein [Cylindrospermopsis raciborskii KL1]|uniref:COP23 domain-containing protein n=1 Tax=Cylindrospermopsis raciborskii TaxID=77022 RepID=UPI001A1BD785|nr:COP23 domain-containing protein [Cylindrospermopsis raciborskii]MBG0744869.1 COP23 domain-containing protein [Cylindrospermopsis raciborskii KL1]